MKRIISIIMVMAVVFSMFSVCTVANAGNVTNFKDYKALLYDILNNPSDYAEGYEDGMAKVEREKFAYADLNNDGIDELIVRFTDTYVAAQIMYVFTYDRANQQVYQLGALSPYSAFFSSGYVKSDAASNQTPGYAIWPFIVSKIDMQAMDILHIANAYCVELSLINGNSMYESEYGRFEDKDNDGILYFFSFTDEEYYGGKKALTIDEFNAEKNRFIHDNQLITLSYHSITKNNIDSIEPEYGSDLSDSGTMKGDLNGDNKITAADARFALRFAARIDVPGESHIKLADVDGNGKITAADARKILRVAAKIDSGFGTATIPDFIYNKESYNGVYVDDAENVLEYFENSVYYSSESEFSGDYIFYTNENITDFCLLDIITDWNTFPDWKNSEVAVNHSFGELRKDCPVVIQMTFHEFVPIHGISFTDANGIYHRYAIHQSGEDGSVYLTEF